MKLSLRLNCTDLYGRGHCAQTMWERGSLPAPDKTDHKDGPAFPFCSSSSDNITVLKLEELQWLQSKPTRKPCPNS
jgi:hypothetical protein